MNFIIETSSSFFGARAVARPGCADAAAAAGDASEMWRCREHRRLLAIATASAKRLAESAGFYAKKTLRGSLTSNEDLWKTVAPSSE